MQRQAGIVLPLVAVALVAIVGVAGLALDLSHLYLNKSRLQNALDAAALSGAKVLDQGHGVTQAASAARDAFRRNAQGAGNGELLDALDGGAITLSVQFSNTLNPFSIASTPEQYVRVIADGFLTEYWFAGVVGAADATLRGSAVAGPSPNLTNVCNIVPVMACGDSDAGAPWYGYTPEDEVILKSSAAQANDPAVGPGNFQIIRLEESGANAAREAMAGKYEQCMDTNEAIETEPGNKVSVSQGLNTRFGIYKGPFSQADADTYKPDMVTRSPPDYPDYQHADYVGDYATGNFTHPDGGVERRVLTVPIGDCTGDSSGQSQVPLLGFGCFYLTQPMVQKGNESEIYGQFIENCNARGYSGLNPGTGPGPHTIQLYKDPDSLDA